jgi:hypothetical protein
MPTPCQRFPWRDALRESGKPTPEIVFAQY